MTQPLQVIPGGDISTTELQERADVMLANRSYIINKIKPLLVEGTDIYTLPGMKKPSLGKPGAEKLAVLFGITTDFAVDKDTIEAIGSTADGKQYLAFVCNAYRGSTKLCEGRGATFVEFKRTNYRNAKQYEYDQAKTKPDFKESDWKEVSGKFGTYWRVKDGEVFDDLALNKAIKMAQKSAYVDAIIRATGMSELFTQDLEDMAKSDQGAAQDQPESEPFPGRPAYEKKPEATQQQPEAPRATEATPDEIKCPVCNVGRLVRRKGPRGEFMGCTSYPNCTHVQSV